MVEWKNLMAEFWQTWPEKLLPNKSLIAEMRKMTKDTQKFHNIYSNQAKIFSWLSPLFKQLAEFLSNWPNF